MVGRWRIWERRGFNCFIAKLQILWPYMCFGVGCDCAVPGHVTKPDNLAPLHCYQKWFFVVPCLPSWRPCSVHLHSIDHVRKKHQHWNARTLYQTGRLEEHACFEFRKLSSLKCLTAAALKRPDPFLTANSYYFISLSHFPWDRAVNLLSVRPFCLFPFTCVT